MLQFSVLSSGSKANCIFVATENTRVLVDCGLSAKQAAKRLELLGIDPCSIDAIIVSHEHIDHVSGVSVFSKRQRTQVWSNRATREASAALQMLSSDCFREFSSGARFSVGDIVFEPFSIDHDAADPVAFRVEHNASVLGIVTDLGQVTALVESQVRGLDALILEANHDRDMLMDGPYPWPLKQRINGRKGHLCNEAAGEVLERINSSADGARLRYAIAAHISEKNNRPELALEAFRSYWNKGPVDRRPEFLVACVEEASPLFVI